MTSFTALYKKEKQLGSSLVRDFEGSLLAFSMATGSPIFASAVPSQSAGFAGRGHRMDSQTPEGFRVVA